MKIVVILPTYNERENIVLMVQALQEQFRAIPHDMHILVVDDNSPDGTADAVRAEAPSWKNLHLITGTKQGLGAAYIHGMKYAIEQLKADAVMEMDADFSHDPRHLPKFLAEIQDADLVIGSRYLNRRVTVINWPMSRLMLSYFANVYARWVTGLKLWDSTGGYKCYRRRVLEGINLDQVRSNGYSFQIETSFRAWKRGFRIKEITITFSDRNVGRSKMSGAIVREAIWMVWQLRLWALLGRI